ncbi:DUF6695 family protein [Lacinutrix sp. Bg11-31]|uniref:DUF6695 family protein n=1 Tax=Lacinutrix sp. Bg11-31 TaxID=2057808 RepID=UPI000C303507|nr:DUF6695 family protein [Lacinutrix sp. Bg11-31]AUC83377.1 hypothetical protein CW733_15055 [Lacinutrix sp. Bg11-31]
MNNQEENTGIIITLAYPDTIVSHAEEWYSPYLRFVGVGSKTSVRAGHAALVLINKETGVLEYHDFGRYITSEPNGRVRGVHTDNELHIPLEAEIKADDILNLDAILKFFATNPKLTHGDGRLVASVCNTINYKKARAHITNMQEQEFIYYAAFKKEACNCARFVTDSLIASLTNLKTKKALENSKWFTPSTVGNVLLANSGDYPFEVSDQGEIVEYKGSQKSENLKCFLDRLKNYKPNKVGTLIPKEVEGLHDKAQWLSGIAAGAWYEVYKMEMLNEYRYKRISPHGNIDCDAIYIAEDSSFNYEDEYKIIHYSNCHFFHLEQNKKVFRFNRKY